MKQKRETSWSRRTERVTRGGGLTASSTAGNSEGKERGGGVPGCGQERVSVFSVKDLGGHHLQGFRAEEGRKRSQWEEPSLLRKIACGNLSQFPPSHPLCLGPGGGE